MSTVLGALQEAQGVKPVANINGTDVYTFQDAKALTVAELMEIKVHGKKPDLGKRELNPDGQTYASSKRRHPAIDPDKFFLNRYRKTEFNGKPAYDIVTDYRAITEQNSGNVYTNNVVVRTIARKQGKLIIAETKQISDVEFVNEFKGTLDHDAMREIFGIIDNLGVQSTKADKLEL